MQIFSNGTKQSLGDIFIGKIIKSRLIKAKKMRIEYTVSGLNGDTGTFVFFDVNPGENIEVFKTKVESLKDKYIEFAYIPGMYNPEYNTYILNRCDQYEIMSEEQILENLTENLKEQFILLYNDDEKYKKSEQIYNKVMEYTEKINDIYLKNGVISFLEASKELLIKSPASLKYHHSYYGGLLFHTLQILDLFDILSKSDKPSVKMLFENIDYDIMVCSIIFHDSGKIICYNDDSLDIEENSKLLEGHIYQSVGYVYKFISTDMKNEKLNKILHCVTSHHGIFYDKFDKTYKKNVLPMTTEAKLLSYLDLISSQL